MPLAIGTRFFETKDPHRVSIVKEFVRRASAFASNVLVAVNTEEDVSGALQAVNAMKVSGATAFEVTPWGKFVAPLNVIISKAVRRGASHLLLASAEVQVTQAIVSALGRELGDQTIVVGAAVIGHDLGDGVVIGTGERVPWNTLAMWNLKYLKVTGFPLIGDAPFDPSQAGVEEVCALSVLQRLYPACRAVLLNVPGVEWDTAHWDPERLAAHQKKMASKRSRSEKQLAEANLAPPVIIHVR
ncbi:MAG: hypothetical protein AAB879_02660 [Patescibacteria group bacterium]